jgi:hypothetical protein
VKESTRTDPFDNEPTELHATPHHATRPNLPPHQRFTPYRWAPDAENKQNNHNAPFDSVLLIGVDIRENLISVKLAHYLIKFKQFSWWWRREN